MSGTYAQAQTLRQRCVGPAGPMTYRTDEASTPDPRHTRPHRTRTRRRGVVAGVAGLGVAVTVAIGVALLAGGAPGPLTDRAAQVREVVDRGPRDTPAAAGADGRIDDVSVGVFDDHPAISGLDPALLEAVREAAAAAAAEDDVELRVTSGWRSPGYQQSLFDRAVAEYGSVEEARRRVLTPDTSRHVSGDAVDIGPTDAAYWMAEHGADHGLCQVYANEIWHYELLVKPDGSCPALIPDSSY